MFVYFNFLNSNESLFLYTNKNDKHNNKILT